MTKRYSILQAKLQELESKLHEPFLHHHQFQNQTHRANLSEDIKQKFAFIKNLLSAEISSSPPSKPHHLHHVAQRIARLEEAFLKWDTSAPFSDEQFDMASSCSCTDSCFNDDGEATGVADFAETKEFCEGFKPIVESKETEGYDGEKKEEAMVEWEGDAEKETQRLGSLLVYDDAEDHFLEGFGHGGLVIRKKRSIEELVKDIVLRNVEMRREEKSTAIRPICGAMACGIVVGMVLMGFTMLKFSGCFHFVDQTCFTIPT